MSQGSGNQEPILNQCSDTSCPVLIEVRSTGHDIRAAAVTVEIKKSSVKTMRESTSRIPVTVVSTGSMVCRICQTNSTQEPLISPCHCKGSMAYVHLSCLERWLNQSSRCYCELCMYHFNAVQTKRYTLFEGVRLWIRHPRNRSHVQSDALIGALLTVITIGLIVVCLLGLQYFVIEAKKLGLSKLWTQAVLGSFLGIICLGYLVTLYLLIKDQVIPWYTWWTHTVDVRLLLTPSVTRGTARQISRDQPPMEASGTAGTPRTQSIHETHSQQRSRAQLVEQPGGDTFTSTVQV